MKLLNPPWVITLDEEPEGKYSIQIRTNDLSDTKSPKLIKDSPEACILSLANHMILMAELKQWESITEVFGPQNDG